MSINGGRLFHLSVWRGMVWLSLLPDRDNTPWHSRNVPRGWRAWELFMWGGKPSILRHHATNS
jgi:hypothetical protein